MSNTTQIANKPYNVHVARRMRFESPCLLKNLTLPLFLFLHVAWHLLPCFWQNRLSGKQTGFWMKLLNMSARGYTIPVISNLIKLSDKLFVLVNLFVSIFLGGVPKGSPTSIGGFSCLMCVWCYKKQQLPGWVFYSPNLYWGQASATSGVQTAEHVYTECTELFSLALTQ